MRSVKKRILSVALSLTMVLGVSMLPASIYVDAANLNSLSNGYNPIIEIVVHCINTQAMERQ